MTPLAAAQFVNHRFQYVSDPDQYRFSDFWKVMDPQSMKGDCEDYALTMLWYLAESKPLKMAWWLLTRKAQIIRYKHRERKTFHAGLKFENMYIDNISRTWNTGRFLDNRGYKKLLAYPAVFVATKMGISLVVGFFK